MQYSDAFIDAALAGDAAFVFLCSKELDVQLDADIRTPSAVCWLAKSLLLSEPAIQLLLFMRSNHGDCCSASELANRPALLSLFDVLRSMENIDDRHIVKAMNKALTMSDKHLIFLSSGPRKLIREYVDSLSNRDDIKKGGRSLKFVGANAVRANASSVDAKRAAKEKNGKSNGRYRPARPLDAK